MPCYYFSTQNVHFNKTQYSLIFITICPTCSNSKTPGRGLHIMQLQKSRCWEGIIMVQKRTNIDLLLTGICSQDKWRNLQNRNYVRTPVNEFNLNKGF
jgi:hypothetical protein